VQETAKERMTTLLLQALVSRFNTHLWLRNHKMQTALMMFAGLSFEAKE
jgi:hypothetical protein